MSAQASFVPTSMSAVWDITNVTQTLPALTTMDLTAADALSVMAVQIALTSTSAVWDLIAVTQTQPAPTTTGPTAAPVMPVMTAQA